jgi:hypothetical protein
MTGRVGSQSGGLTCRRSALSAAALCLARYAASRPRRSSTTSSRARSSSIASAGVTMPTPRLIGTPTVPMSAISPVSRFGVLVEVAGDEAKDFCFLVDAAVPADVRIAWELHQARRPAKACVRAAVDEVHGVLEHRAVGQCDRNVLLVQAGECRSKPSRSANAASRHPRIVASPCRIAAYGGKASGRAQHPWTGGHTSATAGRAAPHGGERSPMESSGLRESKPRRRSLARCAVSAQLRCERGGREMCVPMP